MAVTALGCAAGQNQPIIIDEEDSAVPKEDVVDPTDVPQQPEVLVFDIPPLDTPAATDVVGPDVVPTDGGVAPDVVTPADVVPGGDVCRIVCGSGAGGVCVDTDTDPRNCGRCGNDCAALPGVDPSRVTCERGICNVRNACQAGRLNCTGNPSTGCETAVTTTLRCGSCTTGCAEPTPTCAAMSGAPTGYACTSGCLAPLSARCGGVCVNTDTSMLHCGACGNPCASGAVANGTSACVMGACTFACNATWGNCDGNPANGCETRVSTDLNNCGACGTRCVAPPGGTTACVAGVCTLTCTAGSGDCDRMGGNGCEANL